VGQKGIGFVEQQDDGPAVKEFAWTFFQGLGSGFFVSYSNDLH
jgi:hypothetical protein